MLRAKQPVGESVKQNLPEEEERVSSSSWREGE
jgi:hypothetical protein